jgi:hypothetical protein
MRVENLATKKYTIAELLNFICTPETVNIHYYNTIDNKKYFSIGSLAINMSID